jgi:biopolymer transport protein ExbD
MAFSPSASKKHALQKAGTLSLTSMMDAMTIILLFLLNQFNASGALVTQAKGLKLPESLNRSKPKQATTIAVSSDHITVNNAEIATSEYYVGPINPQVGYIVKPLYDYLDQKATELQGLGNDATGNPLFKGDILIQADRNLKTNSILRVIYTAAQAGFINIKLVTVQGN